MQRAEVEIARGDEAGFAKSLTLLRARFAAKPTPVLQWDQSVGPAVVFAKAKQTGLLVSK